jgi:hypothetical protein
MDLSAELEKLQALKQDIDKQTKSLENEETQLQETQNLLEKLIKDELRVLNGKKMVRN